ncbi:MAG: hypothetical protein ABR98_07590 [Cryomorphaceae bacterium BACL7 MAG-120910-bin2]|nr:MAG: hypothetical protein ABR98_07590 [Cryomorphaceae bacterium BACL7 MAG-120910-bin2]KRO68062.1 MAG: hypothetical protein ABR88_02765 [Cryomorphaceae bacterium BACL7 MAG-120322-bin74]
MRGGYFVPNGAISRALTELFPSVRRITSDWLERLAAFFHIMIKSIDAREFTFQFHYFQYAEQEEDPYSVFPPFLSYTKLVKISLP